MSIGSVLAGCLRPCCLVMTLAIGVCPGGCSLDSGDCGPGEIKLCLNDPFNCRCGRQCISADQCTPSEDCVRRLSMRTGVGGCADPVWAYQGTPACYPTCGAGTVCVVWAERPNRCERSCTAAAQCGSGCCLWLNAGAERGVCMPTPTYCLDRCNPPCAPTSLCVESAGTFSCQRRCATDSDCDRGCCRPGNGDALACSAPGETC